MRLVVMVGVRVNAPYLPDIHSYGSAGVTLKGLS